MADIRGLLRSLAGMPEVTVGTRGEREMPFERVIQSPDGTKRFFFRASDKGRILTIALQGLNSTGGWGNIFEANEMLGEEGARRYMIRLDAVTRHLLTSDHLQIYDGSGKRQDGRMWGLGRVGEAERMIAVGHLAEEVLPDQILIEPTAAAFLKQVRAIDFSTPRLISSASDIIDLTVLSFRDLLI